MCKKMFFLVSIVLVLGLVSGASASLQVKVDLVDAGEGDPWPYTFKGGDWIPWPAWPDDESDEAHDARSLIGVGGLDVNVGLASGCCSNVLETSDGGEEPLCNSWLQSYEDDSGQDISLVIWGDGFTAGEYVVYAYHNDAETERSKMPLIHVGGYCDSNTVGNIGARSSPDCNVVDVEQIHDEETNDVNVVIQNLSEAAGLDDNLVPSVVKFYTDGSPVLITYVSGDGSNAIINAFIIVMPGAQVNAWRPEPGNGARDLCPADVNFYWTPGIYADDHNVYFGTSMDDVNESADAYTEHVAANSWTSPELKVDTTYYWRVETVNDSNVESPWVGTVWTFSTRDGVADDPLPDTDIRGLRPSAITELAWTASCFADTHKVYFGGDLPESVVLFDDGFESDFEPNWPVATGWEWFDANAVDPNLRHSGDYSARAISGGGVKTLTSADVNTADACSVRVELRFRKTVEIQDNEIKLYYWNASLNDYEFIKDLNSLEPNDQWLYYRDDMNESQYLISNFKIKLEANISSGGTVYIDDVKMTNTWPWSLRWYDGREDGNSHSVSLEALTKYCWRVDTVVDGNTIQGDHWTFSTGLGGVIMWLSFDGTLDNDIVPPVSAYTETGKTIEFEKYVIDGTVKYGEANPMNNRDGTSAVFDPCAGLYRLDPCAPSEIDPLRLDGYQYTIEMWVKPTNLSEPLMDDMVLISKGGESDEDDDGDEWQDGSWWIVIENPGTDDDDDNEFRFKRRGESTGMDEDSAVENEWCHIAVVYNQQHPDPGKQHSIFYNGNFEDSEDAGSLNRADNNSPVSIGFGLDDDANFAGASNFFQGLIDEIRILDIALDPDEFLLIPGPEWASRPNPYNGQISIDPNDPNVVLSWTPGIYAQRHKVYLSTDFDDVNSLTPSQDAYLGEFEVNEVNNLDLQFGRTYYWRVDEVNDTCSPNLWVGVIWKFTTRYMIFDENLILWHRFDQDEGDTVTDYSGYEHHGEGDDVSDEHWEPTGGRFDGCLKFDNDIGIGVPETLFEGDNSISDKITVSVWLNGLSTQSADNDMAVFDVGDEDGTYKITALVPSETPDFDVSWRAGNDSNDLLIWDTDRTIIKAWQGTWHHLVFIKDEAEGKMYIYFDGELKWWKEDTINSMTNLQGKEFRIGAYTDHGSDYEGRMDDFRVYNKHLTDEDILKLFRGGDLNTAWNPSPYDGQPDAPYDANLGWKPGDDANKHNVFFGTSAEQVANMTEPCAVKDLGDEDYEPGPLVLDKYYYWRIDEVNNIGDSCTWPGPVWTFKVADYVAVDDFEAYNKTTNQIKDTWRDYWYQSMNPPYVATGGVLDLGVYPYNIVYSGGGGAQSMLYQFKNILWGTPGHPDAYASVCYSEVSLPLPEELQNWTAGGVRVLRLYFYGDVDNDVNATLYVGVKDGGGPAKYAEIRYGEYDPNNEDVNDVNEPEWHRWDIGLTHFKDSNFAAVANDVDLTNIAELLIGFGDKRNPVCGPEGVVIFDDIRLYMPICKPEFGPLADFSGNCIVDMADIGYMAGAWLRHDANYSPAEIEEPNDANLVGWWRLDEGDGNKAEDFSIYDHNSTIEGTYSWVTGHNDVNAADLAVQFTGDGGRVLVPDDNNTPELRPKYQVSVSAWVYFTESQDSARVVVKGQNDEETYDIEIDGTDQFVFLVRDVNGNKYPVPGDKEEEEEEEEDGKNIWPDEWIHLAGTVDGDTNTVKCYINGELDASRDDANFVEQGLTLSQDPNNGLAIGSKAEELDNPFKGTVDDVRVYNYALSEAEVRWLATDGTGYVPLTSLYNLYDKEVPGKQAINFKDFAMLLDDWLKEGLWPPEE